MPSRSRRSNTTGDTNYPHDDDDSFVDLTDDGSSAQFLFFPISSCLHSNPVFLACIIPCTSDYIPAQRRRAAASASATATVRTNAKAPRMRAHYMPGMILGLVRVLNNRPCMHFCPLRVFSSFFCDIQSSSQATKYTRAMVL